jgi:hypothetical protein
VIEARPGLRYDAERKVLAETGGRSDVTIYAREVDGAGLETRRFLQMRAESELADCKSRVR